MAETSRGTTPRGPESGGSRNGVGPDGGPRAARGLGPDLHCLLPSLSPPYVQPWLRPLVPGSLPFVRPFPGGGVLSFLFGSELSLQVSHGLVPGQGLGQLPSWSGSRCLRTLLSSCVLICRCSSFLLSLSSSPSMSPPMTPISPGPPI